MEENVYAPPRTIVADVPARDEAQLRFFAVSPRKLLILSLCTSNLYALYWFYKHWQAIKRHSEPDASPFWRAFFAVFWCFPLFKEIRATEESLHLERPLNAGPLAAGWIIPTLLWRLPGNYGLISFVSMFFLLPAQAHANRVNELVAPEHDRNDRLRGWNWAAVVLGALFWCLVIIGVIVTMRGQPGPG